MSFTSDWEIKAQLQKLIREQSGITGLETAIVLIAFVVVAAVFAFTVLTRTGARLAMVTTKGFRDVIEIRRGTRNDLWDTYKEMAPPYIPRRNRLVVSERIDYAGVVIEPVDEADL